MQTQRQSEPPRHLHGVRVAITGGTSGLGLALVKHAVEAHGGRVSVQSQLGQGSTFTLVVPTS